MYERYNSDGTVSNWYTIADLSRTTKMNRNTLYKRVLAGHLPTPATRQGPARLYYSQEQFDQLVLQLMK